MKIIIEHPISIGEFVLFPANLQQAIIYHNDYGLVAILSQHHHSIIVQIGIPARIEVDIDRVLCKGLVNSAWDFTGYTSDVEDLHSVNNYASIEMKQFPYHLFN